MLALMLSPGHSQKPNEEALTQAMCESQTESKHYTEPRLLRLTGVFTLEADGANVDVELCNAQLIKAKVRHKD